MTAVQGSVMPSSWAVDCGELLLSSPPPEPEAPFKPLPPAGDSEESFGGIITNTGEVQTGGLDESQIFEPKTPGPGDHQSSDAVVEHETVPGDEASSKPMAAEEDARTPNESGDSILRLD